MILGCLKPKGDIFGLDLGMKKVVGVATTRRFFDCLNGVSNVGSSSLLPNMLNTSATVISLAAILVSYIVTLKY